MAGTGKMNTSMARILRDDKYRDDRSEESQPTTAQGSSVREYRRIVEEDQKKRDQQRNAHRGEHGRNYTELSDWESASSGGRGVNEYTMATPNHAIMDLINEGMKGKSENSVNYTAWRSTIEEPPSGTSMETSSARATKNLTSSQSGP